MTRRTLSPPDLNPDGIVAGDWVSKIGGRLNGHVQSVTGDHAYVDWLNGKKEVLTCIFLRRVSPIARPDLDRKRD